MTARNCICYNTAMTLTEFFKKHKKVALAFSGGTDSAYLLYEAVRSGADVKAYFVKSEFQPEFELRDAGVIAGCVGASLVIIRLSVTVDDKITLNSPERCYYCKRRILGAIIERAKEDGYSTIIDGTNLSDGLYDRPGSRAVKEYGVLSPLKEASLTKADIRELSGKAGLFTADKPSYSCLATRICEGERITPDKLGKIEAAENILFNRGYKDFRVRLKNNSARLEISAAQKEKIADDFTAIQEELENIFDKVSLNKEFRK